jgi:glycosyltransferase involved in cell wall biosynthesis
MQVRQGSLAARAHLRIIAWMRLHALTSMHIGFLTTEYPPLPSGGIGTSIQNLARELTARGHRVTVVGWGHAAAFDDQGVQVRFLKKTFLPKTGWLVGRLALQRELRRLVAEEGLRLVEAADWCGLSAGLRPGCPVALRCHGTAVYFGHLLKEAVRPPVRWAEQLAFAGADDVAAVSQFTANLTAQLFELSQPITVIPNGIDPARFTARPAEIDPNTILYLGTLVRKKGVLDLCQAFSLVVGQFPAARLQFVGRDSADRRAGAPSMWALCQEMLSPSIRERAEYIGEVPYCEVSKYINRAGLCVFPSYAEALPLSWLEVMACGKPVVAYDIGWAREVVEHGSTGLLVKRGDVEGLAEAVLQLLRNPSLGRSFGERGRSQVQAKFSVGAMAEASIDWYQRVLERAGCSNHGNRSH